MQRHIEGEGLLPRLDRVRLLQAAFNQQLAGALGDGVDLCGNRLVDLALVFRNVCQVLAGILGVDARAAVLHFRIVRVDLGNLLVVLLGMAVVQVLLHLADAHVVLLHLLQNRVEFLVDEVLSPLGGAAMEQLFLDVGIPLVTDLTRGVLDGRLHALEVNVLVLQCANQIVLAILAKELGVGNAFPGLLVDQVAVDVAARHIALGLFLNVEDFNSALVARVIGIRFLPGHREGNREIFVLSAILSGQLFWPVLNIVKAIRIRLFAPADVCRAQKDGHRGVASIPECHGAMTAFVTIDLAVRLNHQVWQR